MCAFLLMEKVFNSGHARLIMLKCLKVKQTSFLEFQIQHDFDSQKHFGVYTIYKLIDSHFIILFHRKKFKLKSNALPRSAEILYAMS